VSANPGDEFFEIVCETAGGLGLDRAAARDLLAGQPAGHQPDYRDLDLRLGLGALAFVVRANPRVPQFGRLRGPVP
jgi:hypothetical protein